MFSPKMIFCAAGRGEPFIPAGVKFKKFRTIEEAVLFIQD